MRATVVPIYKEGNRSVFGNCRSFSLTPVEQVIAGYLRQVWEMSGWVYEVQHVFRPG